MASLFLPTVVMPTGSSSATSVYSRGAMSSAPSVVSESSLDSIDNIDLESTAVDPSVIVGMACRVPGATNTSQLWNVLAEKKDLQRKMPEDRFNVDAFYHPQGANKGTVFIYLSQRITSNAYSVQTNARYGYFLDQELSLFDNEFFRISGKEAEAMDPQQRLLLEVVYEALENGKPRKQLSKYNSRAHMIYDSWNYPR
jgi:hypothetical protein